jgi:hypothetical protein
MKKLTFALLTLAAVVLVAAGCGGSSPSKARQVAVEKSKTPVCPAAWRKDWQQLANKVGATVYCPSWLPSPLTGQLGRFVSYGGAGGPAASVSNDHSYLVSMAWAEPQTGEVHVNLRGYPGRMKIPTCIAEDYNAGKLTKTPVPCFNDARGKVTERGITATVYTVNQDADMWHVLYAWHHNGGLYTVSEHIALPLTYSMVVANLHKMLRGLVPLEPKR